MNRIPNKTIVVDFCFIVSFAVFVVLAYMGNMDITPDGIGLDSDLQNYTQIVDWSRNPDAYRHDPIAYTFGFFPGMPNLMIALSGLFSGATYQTILKAGCLSIFIFLSSFYLLGRYLFARPSLAAIFSLLMSITVYWAYGTFWGATQSDPVPRILASAVFPLLLLVSLKWDRSFPVQSIVMFACALTIFIHSITGIALAAMFFMAFAIHGNYLRMDRNMAKLAALGASFLVPALFLIGKMRIPTRDMTADDFSILNEMWHVRFEHNFSDLDGSILGYIHMYFFERPLLSISMVCAIFLYIKRRELSEKIVLLCKYSLCFVIGLLLVVIFVAIEIHVSSYLGKIQLSSDLLRGTKFILPIAWFPIVILVHYVDTRFHVAKVLCAAAFIAIFLLSSDKQVSCARHYVADTLGIEFLDRGYTKKAIAFNSKKRDALLILKQLVPEDKLVFTDMRDMSIRYFCHRPLFPVMQDGDNLYFNKDTHNGKVWLDVMNLLQKENPDVFSAWKASSADYFFSNSPDCRNIQRDDVSVVYADSDWSLCRLKK